MKSEFLKPHLVERSKKYPAISPGCLIGSPGDGNISELYNTLFHTQVILLVVQKSEIQLKWYFIPFIYKVFLHPKRWFWWPDFWSINRLIRPKVRQTLWCWVLSLVTRVAAKFERIGVDGNCVELGRSGPTSLNLGHAIYLFSEEKWRHVKEPSRWRLRMLWGIERLFWRKAGK